MPLTSSPLPLTPPSPPRGGDDGRGEIRRIKVARFFLSIGSNLGERRQNLQAAIQRLRAAERIRVLEVSRLYETEPWERAPGQIGNRAGWFLNCVVAVETGLAPAALLSATQEIEEALGRVRTGTSQEAGRDEPRALDIDILLYGVAVAHG